MKRKERRRKLRERKRNKGMVFETCDNRQLLTPTEFKITPKEGANYTN